ncbi:Flp family type IVb pilin [Paractinoplanes maris]|uniref:Flp family type IVb pilin n=1 Tax=Paractinoplanes maris TaxID=1734446 RepID=UPI0020220AAE|nr:Flp family type IVb pilin [Actinoplanes maris]
MLPLHYVAAYVQSHVTAIKDRMKDDEGATAVEYGLLVSLVALVIIVGAGLFGTKLNSLFTKVAEKIVIPT